MVKSEVRLASYWNRLEVYQGPAGGVLGPAKVVLDPARGVSRVRLGAYLGMRIVFARGNDNRSQ
jgi:hypothetical protein